MGKIILNIGVILNYINRWLIKFYLLYKSFIFIFLSYFFDNAIAYFVYFNDIFQVKDINKDYIKR